MTAIITSETETMGRETDDESRRCYSGKDVALEKRGVGAGSHDLLSNCHLAFAKHSRSVHTTTLTNSHLHHASRYSR